jgi:conjugal transfer pilus assembly protein TraV
MNISIVKAAFTFGAIIILSGCASLGANTEKDFLCEAQIGSPCTSISAVDGTTSAAIVPISEKEEDSIMASLNSQGLSEKEKTGISSYGSYSYDGSRYRVAETISKLWIAPYLDENQILHEGRYVHFVLTDARWVRR